MERGLKKKRWWFTLAELIVVITVLAILATIGFLALSGYAEDAKSSATKANVRSIATAIASESAITGNSPRHYVEHDADYALSGAFVYVDWTAMPLTGGNVWSLPTDSNYTAGKPKYPLLKLNPEKFKISASDRIRLPWTPANAAFEASSAAIWALDVTRGKRMENWFQVAAVVPATKTAVVVGNFPDTMTWSNAWSPGNVPGLVAVGVPGTAAKTVLVDGWRADVPSGDSPASMSVTENPATALAFWTVAANSPMEKTLNVQNSWANGSRKLTVTTGAVSAPFSITSNSCTDVTAWASCAIVVRYSPTAAASSTWTLVLTPSEWTPSSFSMSGTGGWDPSWSNVTGLFRFENTSSPFANTKVSANSLTWSYTLAPHYTASWKFGNSALFNGTSQYAVGSAGILTLSTTTSYTVEAWTRLDSAIPVSAAPWQWAAIFARHGDWTRLFMYYARFPAQAGWAPTHVCVSWANWLSTFRSADACAVLPSTAYGTWNHVAVSHDGATNTPTLFFNGKKLGTSVTNSTSLAPNTGANNNFFVGATNIGSGYEWYFPGAIDDMRVTVGTARYDKDFVPPVGQYPAF